MLPQDTIKSLSNTSSRKEKMAILESHLNTGEDTLFFGLKMSYDPMITFGVRQIPHKVEGSDGPGITWGEFSALALDLADRVITGNAARDAINDLSKKATVDEWNFFYRRVLTKKMGCGIQAPSVNQFLSDKNREDLSIALFQCQLANDAKNHPNKLSGKKFIQAKLNGVRCLSVCYPDGTIMQYTRNGRILNNFPDVRASLSEVMKQSGIHYPIVLDGEIISQTFAATLSNLFRKHSKVSSDASLFIFDIIPLDSFRAGYWATTQRERDIFLSGLEPFTSTHDNLSLFTHEEIDLDTEEGKDQLSNINERVIKAGFEGIMIKDPDAPYESKRSSSWLKMKPFIEVTLTINDVVEGEEGFSGIMGALVCSGVDDGKYIMTNVGTGFTLEQRIDFWDNREKMKGLSVEVIADEISNDKHGNYSLRFARYKTIRGFKKGEKI